MAEQRRCECGWERPLIALSTRQGPAPDGVFPFYVCPRCGKHHHGENVPRPAKLAEPPTVLRADPKRVSMGLEVGIPIRAQLPDGTWKSVDIIQLTTESFLAWLHSRPDENLAERVLLHIFGYRNELMS